MSGRNGDYPNSKVGFEQDADKLFMDDDGYLYFENGDYVSGEQLKALLHNRVNSLVIANSAGALSTLNIAPSYGYVVFSIADAASNASAWLASGAIAGMAMAIMMRGVGSTGSVYISTSGVTIIGTVSGELSSFSLGNSATSHARVDLYCFDDGEWTIVSKSGDGGNITERGAS